MALTFEVGINDQISKPATDAAKAMAASAAQAKVLSNELRAVDVALLKASAVGASTKRIESLKLQHEALAGALAKVGPAAEAFAATEHREAEAAKAAAAATELHAKQLQNQLALESKARAEHVRSIFKAGDDAASAAKAQAEKQKEATDTVKANWAAMGGIATEAAAVVVAAYAAIGAAVYVLAEKALDSTSKLKLLTAQLESLGGGAPGSAYVELVDTVANRTGQARDEVGRLAKTFEGIGITDLGKLETALAAAHASSLISAGGSSAAFESLSKKIEAAADNSGKLKIADKGLKLIAETGVRASEVAAQLGVTTAVLDARLKAGTQNAQEFGDALSHALIDKGAKAVDVAANSLAGIKNRFANAFDRLFDGVETGPFLEQLSKLADFFDDSTDSGKAMKLVITEALNAIFDWGAAVLPVIKDMATLFLIAALGVLELTDSTDEAKESLGALALQLLPGGPLIAGIIALPTWFSDWGPAAVSAASDFIEGLVKGIGEGAERVASAAANVAHSAVDAVEKALGIASPSVVMAEVGSNVAEGMAVGMAANDNVGGAARDMGQSAYVEAGQAAGAATGGGGGNTYHFDIGGLHVNGAGKDMQEVTEEALALMLERAAASQGLGTVAA